MSRQRTGDPAPQPCRLPLSAPDRARRRCCLARRAPGHPPPLSGWLVAVRPRADRPGSRRRSPRAAHRGRRRGAATAPSRPAAPPMRARASSPTTPATCSPRSSPDGVIREVSAGCLELLELAPEELAGTRAADLVHPGDSTTHRRAMRDSRTATSASAITVRLRRADGSLALGRRPAARRPRRAARWPRSTPRSATSTPAPRPSAPRPTPRRASGPRSRRRRSAWRSPRSTAASCRSTARCARSPAACRRSSRARRSCALLHPEDREDETEALARLARGSGIPRAASGAGCTPPARSSGCR